MAVCDICGASKGSRMLSGTNVCEQCFDKIQRMRAGDRELIEFYSSPSNLCTATPKGREYILNQARIQHEHLVASDKQRMAEAEVTRAKEEATQKEYAIELDKQNFANSFNEFYEYDVVTIINENRGCVDKAKMMSILSEHARKGWRLHSIYSNELGKNAIGLIGLGVNSTACEDVLIFERRVEHNPMTDTTNARS